MYFDKFDLGGNVIPVQDTEAREIIKGVLGSISGSSGDSTHPIFLENGAFIPCGDVLDVDISGEAQTAVHAMSADSATEANHAGSADTATEANHAGSADNATNADYASASGTASRATQANTANKADSATNADHATLADNATNADYATASGTASRATEANLATKATSADSATTAEKLGTSAGSSTKPVYFSGGKPVQCGGSLGVDITGGSAKTKKVVSYDTLAYNGGVSGWGNEQTLYDKNGARVGYVNTYYHGNADGNVDLHIGADKGAIHLDAYTYGNISHATNAANYSHPAVQSSPFIRVTLNNSLGTMYIVTGTVTLTINTSTAYGNGYIGDFTISIPSAVRCPNGHYSVQITCTANSKVCIASLNTTTNLSQLQGWVQSNISSSTNVLFNVTILGY